MIIITPICLLPYTFSLIYYQTLPKPYYSILLYILYHTHYLLPKIPNQSIPSINYFLPLISTTTTHAIITTYSRPNHRPISLTLLLPLPPLSRRDFRHITDIIVVHNYIIEMRNVIVGRRGWDKKGKGGLVIVVKLNRRDERYMVKDDWLCWERVPKSSCNTLPLWQN